MMWRITESSEGDLRAWRGNGAENSSQSKGREGSQERKGGRLFSSCNTKWGPISLHLVEGGGRQPADTAPLFSGEILPPPSLS